MGHESWAVSLPFWSDENLRSPSGEILLRHTGKGRCICSGRQQPRLGSVNRLAGEAKAAFGILLATGLWPPDTGPL